MRSTAAAALAGAMLAGCGVLLGVDFEPKDGPSTDVSDPATSDASNGSDTAGQKPAEEKTDGGRAWKKTWKLEPVGGGRLTGIWGADTGPIWVVGSGTTTLVVLRSDGNGTWGAESTKGHPDWTGTELHAIWGSGGGDLLAVGSVATPYVEPVVLHFYNGQWSVWDFGCAIQTQTKFVDVWGTSVSNIYTTGKGICHRRQDTTTGIEYAGENATRLWGSGPSDVYAVGTTIVHSNGTATWTEQAAPGTVSLASVWGSGPSDIYAAGSQILHSTGDGQWTPLDSGVTVDLFGVFPRPDGSVYVVGDEGTILHAD